MKKLFTLLFVFLLNSAWATNYYFSAVSGDDSRSVTQAKSSSTPWKTLSKLNSVFSTLLPGDSVLLKRGETFYGSIIVKKSGISTARIVIGAYGSGNKPVVTSLVSLSAWVSKGNGIYESTNSALGANVKIVLLNGLQQELGRYPNSNAANKGYLYFESHSGTTSITDQQLTSSTNWTGADVVIRPRRWVIARNLITSHSGTTISYKASTSYAPTDKFGYFFENSIKALDKFGEWYYNPSTHKLSVYFGSNNPSSYTVQVPTSDDIIHAEKFSYVTLTNLVLKGANTSSVNIRYGSNIYLTNCDINFSGENGIKTFYHTYLKVEGCTINNSNYGGIYMGYNGSNNAIIRNNKIINTSLFPGMAQSGDQAGLGIMSYGNYNIIEYNEIRKTGYNGITFNGHDVTVKNNYIDSFCFVKDDGGGIYAHAGGSTTVRLNRKIIGNIVMNGLGAPDGAYNPWGVPVEGIYMDEGTANVEVTGNTIANCTNQGIYFHNSHNIKVLNNTIFTANNRYMAMLQSANKPLIRNNTISGNIFFANLGSQTLLYLNSPGTDELQFGKFYGNYYARPADINTATVLSKIRVYETTAAIKSFTTALRFEYNATTSAKTIALDASYVDAKNKSYSGSITIQPYASVVLIRTGNSTNVAPTVSITSPVANTSFTAPASITISAAADDANGTISKVDFYNGNTLLGTDKTSPYTFSWNNVAAGKYTITAKATDNSSLVTTSAAVAISVSALNVAPSVSITSPVANATFTAPASITISATAADANGTISKVDFYNGNTLLGTDNTNPYTFSWNNVPAGKYTVIAKATDNGSLVTTSAAVSFGVATSEDTLSDAPSVSITSPVANAIFDTSVSVTISAVASDTNGTITKVDFYNNDTLLETDTASPYTFIWDNVPAGRYSITAKATDNDSRVTTSSSVAFSIVTLVDTLNIAPSVSITSPVQNATFAAPASVTITAAASDADGAISKVEFYNNDTLLETVTASPYTFTWSNVPLRNYSITAKATDNIGLQTTSKPVTVTVLEPAANKAPVVSITSPLNNAAYTAPATITINAAATDADGTISKVQFYRGGILLNTNTTSPYTYTLTNVAAGNYTFIAVATDNKGAIGSSSSVSVAVSVTPNKAPVVNITTPITNVVYNIPATININATAMDADGSIVNVKFYRAGTYLGVDSTSPYTYTMTNVAPGTYSLVAKATDNKGLTSSSSSIAVQVSGETNKAPVVNITSPANNAVYTAPATITINALASDADGTISNVKFYNGTTYLKTIFTSPYTYTISNLPTGTYSLTAKATDNNGLQTISAPVKVTVTALNKAPKITLVSPVANTTFSSPATITISANASDEDGTISSVQLYRGTTLIAVETYAPYTYFWKSVPAGKYTITAKAIDNKGAVTTSSSVAISVIAPTVSLKSSENNDTAKAINNAHAVTLKRDFLSIAEPKTHNVKVFPNPAVNKIQISVDGLQTNNEKGYLSITNLAGIIVRNIPVVLSRNTLEADVSSLSPGVYIVSIVSDNFQFSKKFLKN